MACSAAVFWGVVAPPLSDAVVAPCWLAATLLLAATAWKVARRLFPHDGYLSVVQHSVLLSWAAIVLVATTLGAARLLGGWTILLGVVAASLAALAVLRATPGGRPPAVAAPGREELAWLALWVGVAAYLAGHVINNGLLRLPADYDSLAYHLPLIDLWLRDGSLYATGCSRWANPGNNELVALWAVGPFSGDFLAGLNNVPATALLACGCVDVAARVGLPRPLAHLAGLAVVSNYVVLQQLIDQENDVAVAACFFAALSYALRHAATWGGCDKGRRASLLLGAISLGLLAGIKYYALGYALLAFGLWLLLAQSAGGLGSSLRVLAVGAAGLLLWGGFWYVRNWALTGSPLFPREFFKHPDLLSQIHPGVARSSFLGNRHPELGTLFLHAVWQVTGPCQLLAVLAAPACAAWLLGRSAWLALGGAAGAARSQGSVALLLLGTALLLGITPMAVEDVPGTLNQMYGHYCPVRYGFCFLSVAVLAAMLLLRDLLFRQRPPDPSVAGSAAAALPSGWGVGVRRLAYVTIGGCVLFQLALADRRLPLEWFDCVLTAFTLLALAAVCVTVKPLWPKRAPRPAFVLLLAMLPAAAGAGGALASHWHRKFIPHFLETSEFTGLGPLERLRAGRDTTLVLEPRYYPYFGSHRQHRVVQPVYVPSATWLMDYLQEEEVTHVVARRSKAAGSRGRFVGFPECLSSHPERFRSIEQVGDHVAVEVVPAAWHASALPGAVR